MIQILRYILIIPLLLLLMSCGEEINSGPGEVRWDREICARCAMAVSDHSFSAQVRGGRADKKSKLYKFDDVGCAVIWLDKQAWKDDARTEIWVNDHRNQKWINAKTAWYVKISSHTPMDYGLGAQTDKQEAAFNFDEAKTHIYEVEKRFNIHSAQPLKLPPSAKLEPSATLKPSATLESSVKSAKENKQ